MDHFFFNGPMRFRMMLSRLKALSSPAHGLDRFPDIVVQLVGGLEHQCPPVTVLSRDRLLDPMDLRHLLQNLVQELVDVGHVPSPCPTRWSGFR